MAGSNRQFQPKKLNVPNESDLPPLIFSPSRSRRDDEWIEENELLAEDDPLDSNPPRTSTSALRWSSNTSGRRGTVPRDVSSDTTRQQVPVSTRRTTDLYAPTTGPVRVRYGRNRTYDSTTSGSSARKAAP
ncbi:MAG TPA: hypothetical protein VEI53_04795, partial [Ktedonobacteraceae bacterium]|nr:hypothetical protein [Ktedonobacteraceae bacterium]